MAGEFSIIDKYFKREQVRDDNVVLGIGDDAAILAPPANQQLVITTDTLNSGIHFPASTGASDLAHKALMVNLSDLAAMGATPRWLTLSVSMPAEDELWLRAFSEHFHQLLRSHQLSLIGGDTTRGPLSITITAIGIADADRLMRRDAAEPGDIIAVTGTLGDAGLGLQCALHQRALNRIEHTGWVLSRLNRPQARLNEARLLREHCRCAIDLSDGLASDLQHILNSSGCAAVIDVATLPLSKALIQECSEADRVQLAVSAGDDYELCVCIAPEYFEAMQQQIKEAGGTLTAIGHITERSDNPRIDWQKKGHPYPAANKGWDHFV